MRRRAGAVALSLALILPSLSAAAIPRAIEPTPTILFRPIDGPSAATPRPTRFVPSISDFRGPERSRPKTSPEQKPKAIAIGPVVPGEQLGRSISGLASWYCKLGHSPCHRSYPDGPRIDAYAAAGPRLRAAICGVQSCTSWRGRTVYVDGIAVKLVDWCQCYWRQPHEKLIDLYWDVFKTTGSSVTIGW